VAGDVRQIGKNTLRASDQIDEISADSSAWKCAAVRFQAQSAIRNRRHKSLLNLMGQG
jgi:hypothetical protein